MDIKDPASSTSCSSTDADCGFAGTLKNIQLNDLIQMCCLSASSLCMRVTKGNRQGTVFIVDGEIVHAACEDIEGEEAFYRILGWQTGSFESLEVSSVPRRTIDKNYHFMIMEAARRADERGAQGEAAEETVSPAADRQQDDRLRVLIVDDSPMMRKILSSMLATSNRVNVVGMAGNGKEAIRLIDDLAPDLVTLDVNMPVMDGTSTIKHIMIKNPCPVVIMSNPGDGSSRTIFNFLELGAVDFLGKPTKNHDILVQQEKLLERITIAATAKVKRFRIPRIPKPLPPSPTGTDHPLCRRLVLVLSGPGGHPEQMQLLPGLVPALGGESSVIALQALPPSFSEPYAHYLTERCGVPAFPIGPDTPLCGGNCYVGVTGTVRSVTVKEQRPYVDCREAENAPASIDRLLSSAAAAFGERLTVVLLSGANAGSLEGLREVHAGGGRVVVRKRSTTLVDGPLDRVVDAGLAHAEPSPDALIGTICGKDAP